MPLLQVGLLVPGTGIVLWRTCTPWPTVRDLSANPALQPLLHRLLPLRRPTTNDCYQ